MGPMSILVGGLIEVDFNKLKISQGDIFEFNKGEIICIEKNIFISLNHACKWSSSINCDENNSLKNYNLSEQELLENINIMENKLKVFAKHNVLGSLVNMALKKIPDIKIIGFYENKNDREFEFIKDRFMNFINALIIGNLEIIEHTAKEVIGFGCGLTPAMDDFIGGLMASYICMGNYYRLNLPKIYEVNKSIIKNNLNKTTTVSAEMLKHSSVGEVNEAARNLMSVMFNSNENKNPEDIINALIEVGSYGETSGTDTMFGIYVGLKILSNFKFRRTYLNEFVCRD